MKSPEFEIYPQRSLYRIYQSGTGKIKTPISVRLDQCDRLWLLDAAVNNISGVQGKGPPALHLFNLATDHLIRSYVFPTSQWTYQSFFANLIVESHKSETGCDETFAYIADFNRFHLVTYDFEKNSSYVKSHHFFNPDPLIFTPNEFIYNAQHQDLNGIYGLALARDEHNDTSRLYFHPLASLNEFSIPTELLKTDKGLSYNSIHVFENKGQNAESSVSVFDEEKRILLYAEVNTRKIGCWNLDFLKGNLSIDRFYSSLDLKIKDGFIVDISILGPELWLLVYHDSNIRVYKEIIADLVRGTSCDVGSATRSSSSPLQQTLLGFFACFCLQFCTRRSWL